MSKKIVLDSSYTHVQGASEFIDDRAKLKNEVIVTPYLSNIAHAKIKKIEIKEALSVPGIVNIFSAKDIAHNLWGTIFQDQQLLADERINFNGEPILLIVGENEDAIRHAKKLIKVHIEPMPAILSIKDAIKNNSFIMDARYIERGDIKTAFTEAKHILSGELEIAGQEHFYLENQSAITYPKEGSQLEIHSSSQHPTEVQHIVAHALNLKDHEVVCIVKRMGGGFGGKESQAVPFAVYSSLVALKLKRPARIVVSKDDDMMMTGKRNPFEIYYKVAYTDEGKITALDIELYSNSGAYADLSTSIMERAMLHSDNAYYIPNIKIKGHVCKTNHAPTTAFRGFGGPKGVAAIENIIEEIAVKLKKDALDIREINCYRGSNNITPYGQVIDQEILPNLFTELKNRSHYTKLRNEVNKFNANSKTHLKGLALTAVKFGISFTTRFLNQGNALVNLHMDGTFQVSTGATEMGQGVNTKIALAVASVFNIPVADVKVMPTSTEKNHNTSPTAASSGSDINAGAARQAAMVIKNRLALVAREMLKRNPDDMGKKAAGLGTASEIIINEVEQAHEIVFDGEFVFDETQKAKKLKFTDVILEAYLNRVSLGAYSFFRYPGIYFNKLTGKGNPFFYFTNGVALSEVFIDKFTGELKVSKAHILMDIGRPMIKGIDYGQVCGAFIQGMGWVTTEKLNYGKDGKLLTHSPSTYKIPSIQDIPRDFKIEFLENDENAKNVMGSKAVGEPPLLMGISVWAAVKNALSYLGEDQQRINIPATQEEILMKI